MGKNGLRHHALKRNGLALFLTACLLLLLQLGLGSVLPTTPLMAGPEQAQPYQDDGGECLPTEADSFLALELESFTGLGGDWKTISDDDAASGQYIIWEGEQHFWWINDGEIYQDFNIVNPGIYRIKWRNQSQKEPSGDHNDTWMKVSGGDVDFYGLQTGTKAWPKGSGKTPNPNGAGALGYFKVYTSGADWTWNTRTGDDDNHQIYAEFPTAGTYRFEVAARSSFHAVDRVVLYDEVLYSSGQEQDRTRPANGCDGPLPTPTPAPATATPVITPTVVITPTATLTPTLVPTATETPTPLPVDTSTATPLPSPTPTMSPTALPTATPTDTPSPIPSPTPTATAAVTATLEPAATSTMDAPITVTPTTEAPTVVASPTASAPEPTGSALPTETATATMVPTDDSSLSILPAKVALPGSSLYIQGMNFLPSQPLTVFIKGTLVGIVSANADGEVGFIVTTVGADDGAYEVTLEGNDGVRSSISILLDRDADEEQTAEEGTTFAIPVVPKAQGEQSKLFLPLVRE